MVVHGWQHPSFFCSSLYDYAGDMTKYKVSIQLPKCTVGASLSSMTGNQPCYWAQRSDSRGFKDAILCWDCMPYVLISSPRCGGPLRPTRDFCPTAFLGFTVLTSQLGMQTCGIPGSTRLHNTIHRSLVSHHIISLAEGPYDSSLLYSLYLHSSHYTHGLVL